MPDPGTMEFGLIPFAGSNNPGKMEYSLVPFSIASFVAARELWVKVSGTWGIAKGYAKVSGTWQGCKVYVKVSGSWILVSDNT